MCFSATASLVAGSALTLTGVATISLTKSRRELPLASIPLFFGLQQLIDGVVWLSTGSPMLNLTATYAYAFLAFVFWPLYIPHTLLSIETRRVRREVLKALALVGAGVGAFFLYHIVTNGATSSLVNHCVAYATPHPYGFPILAFYLIATAGPFFVSSKKLLNIFGAILVASFGLAGWFYFETFSSTWCFFSAILSGIIYAYFTRSK